MLIIIITIIIIIITVFCDAESWSLADNNQHFERKCPQHFQVASKPYSLFETLHNVTICTDCNYC